MNALTKIVSGIVSVGLLAAAMWLYGRKPHLQDGMQDPITSHGRIGAVVDNPVFSVKVTRVDVASTITKPDPLGKSEAMPTPGLFVIVHLNVRSNQKPFQPGHVRLTARGGLDYEETGRPEIITSSATFEPMLWGQTSFIFEIPKDRLAGARLIVGEADLMNQLSAETDVDLGMDHDTAVRLAAHPSPDYVLTTP